MKDQNASENERPEVYPTTRSVTGVSVCAVPIGEQ